MPDHPIWSPNPARIAASNLKAFADTNGTFGDYPALHQWSIKHPDIFWLGLWEFCGVVGEPGNTVLADGDKMPGARWFPDARLNFAENLLRRRDDADAVVFRGEDRVQRRLSHAELYDEVARMAAAFTGAGVEIGDRIAAWLPNMPEALIGMLAAASIGAIFSSCSPDFGVEGVVDRFGQIQPKILIAADGYFYNGKTVPLLQKLGQIVERLPTLEKVLVVPYAGQLDGLGEIPKAQWIADFLRPHSDTTEITFRRLPFDHPLYILYSSGTTGIPKCLVHGAGGTLLQHLKEHQLHGDIKPGDRLFYFTTCGWMMWNWLVTGLASGAALMLYDGSPFLHDGRVLFDFAEQERFTHFGTSPKFLAACAKAGLSPVDTHQFPALRTVFSTGSPLTPEGFDYVYEAIKHDVHLASISGGTDIVAAFVGGSLIDPVWRGEIQRPNLGMAVDVFDEHGHPLPTGRGELVCTKPFPSMPLGFLNDPHGTRYRAAYFDRFPGVWAHGDFAEFTEHGGILIHGRSDAVLNPGGVRIGTAEIYRQVERLPEILESIAIGQQWDGDVRVVLFVRLRDGAALDENLRTRIRTAVREGTTPRHVPAKIVAVADIPRTKSGKLVELAVRDIVHGRPVGNREAMANPEALDLYQNLDELQH